MSAPCCATKTISLTPALSREANKNDEQLWLMDLAAAASMDLPQLQAHRHMHQLTATKHKTNNSAQFSPCGDFVAFLSNRSGSSAVWTMPVRRPGEPRLLAELPVDVGDLQWLAEPGWLVVSAEVLADGGEDVMQATADTQKAREESGVKAILYSSLPVRRWDHWIDDTVTHPFVLPLAIDSVSGEYVLDTTAPRDLLQNITTSCPHPPFGDSNDWAIGPVDAGTGDRMLAVSIRPPLARDEAWSTNRHIYLRSVSPLEGVDSADGGVELLGECVSEGNYGYDTNPVFSPDGTQLAWLSMATPGYEADAQRIKILDLRTREVQTLAPDWPYSPDGIRWSAAGDRLFFSASINARTALCSLDLGSSEITMLQGTHGSTSLCEEIPQSKQLLVKHQCLSTPAELYLRSSSSSVCDVEMKQLTFFNHSKLASIRFGEVEELHFSGAKSEQVWGTKPSGSELIRRRSRHGLSSRVVGSLIVATHSL